MKPWTYYAAGFAVATSMTLASCGDDDTVDVPEIVPSAPTVSLRNPDGSDFDGSAEDVPVNSLRELTVSVADVDDNLNDIEFLRNGTSVSLASGFVKVDSDDDGTTENSQNPVLIAPAGQGTFSEDYFFQAPQGFDETVTYTITVTDTDGLETSEDFTITTQSEPVASAPLVDTMGVLFNRDGPNLGAFDLDSLQAVASNSDASELQDAGINTDLPDDENWRKVIIAENGAIISRINEEDAMTFDYDAVNDLQSLRNLFANDAVVETQGGTRTQPLSEGSVFLVEANEDYYLIRVATLNETDDDNTDSYELDIKSGPVNDE